MVYVAKFRKSVCFCLAISGGGCNLAAADTSFSQGRCAADSQLFTSLNMLCGLVRLCIPLLRADLRMLVEHMGY